VPEEYQGPEPEDIDFARETANKLYQLGDAKGINPLRWERVQDEILFSDVVEEVLGKVGSPISCPFHGTDSTPSFYVYPPARGNVGFCFGCPPPTSNQIYDSVKLVSMVFDINRVKALTWLEKKWNLPPMEDVVIEKDEEEEISLEFDDLSEPYILKAAKDIQATRDLELANEYLRIYFLANRDQTALPLARVLGREVVQRVMRTK